MAVIRFCVRCTISSMRPRITFDAEGVCSACRFAEKKALTNWGAREEELRELLDRYRSSDGSFDVVVPCSGGKDGGFVAHQLKHKYGMHPLCASFAPLLPTEIGQKNLAAFIASGFDVIQCHPNGQAARKLARLAFEHMGDPFQPFIYGQTNFPMRVAVAENIKLVFYAEDGENEYTGSIPVERAKRDPQDNGRHYFSGKDPEFWQQFGITDNELEIFEGPRAIPKGTEIHFFGYYRKHVPQENFYYCSANTGFQPNPARTVGTYSKYASIDDELDFLHYYCAFLKFGIGRATSDTAHEIRDGHITRDEGVALVHKYDGEFSDKIFAINCDYMGLSVDEGHAILQKLQSPTLWENGLLKYRVA